MGAKALNSDSFSGAGGHAGGYQIDLLVQVYPGQSVCHGSLGWSTIALLRGHGRVALIDVGAFGIRSTLIHKLAELGLTPFMLVIALTLFFLVLGCFLDGISMVVLTISVLLPTIQAAGLDLIWFGVFIVLVVEVAQITPPVGLNLFVLQGLTKRDIGYIAGTVLPMFAIMMLAIVLIYFFPVIGLWLDCLR